MSLESMGKVGPIICPTCYTHYAKSRRWDRAGLWFGLSVLFFAVSVTNISVESRRRIGEEYRGMEYHPSVSSEISSVVNGWAVVIFLALGIRATIPSAICPACKTPNGIPRDTPRGKSFG